MTSKRGDFSQSYRVLEATRRVESDCSNDSDSVLSLSYPLSSFEGNGNSDVVSESSDDRGPRRRLPRTGTSSRTATRLQPKRTSLAKTKIKADLATVNGKESSCNQNPPTSCYQLEIHHPCCTKSDCSTNSITNNNWKSVFTINYHLAVVSRGCCAVCAFFDCFLVSGVLFTYITLYM